MKYVQIYTDLIQVTSLSILRNEGLVQSMSKRLYYLYTVFLNTSFSCGQIIIKCEFQFNGQRVNDHRDSKDSYTRDRPRPSVVNSRRTRNCLVSFSV